MKTTNRTPEKKFLLLLMLFLFNFQFNGISQTESEADKIMNRKITRLMNAERDVYRLPLDKDYIRQTVIPEVLVHRNELAPHYPIQVTNSEEEKKILIKDWIINYEAEYQNYIAYFEAYLRSYL